MMPLPVFVVDDDSPIQRRQWAELLGHPERRAHWERGYFAEIDGAPIPDGSLVIVHESSSGDEEEWSYRKNWLETHLCWTVMVSGEATRQRTDPTALCYRRHAAVLKGVIDRAFANCFRRFLKALEATGSPQWRLLEPSECPEYLCSLYLLILAKDGGVDVDESALGQGFWQGVANEWRTLVDERGINYPSSVRVAATPPFRSELRALLSET